MNIRMPKLSRTPTGLWTSRKVIPEDVREALGKREDKPTWPASLTVAQARAAFADWQANIEHRIALARQQKTAAPVRLTARQMRALAGKWYDTKVRQYEDDPGEADGWEAALHQLEPRDPKAAYRAYLEGAHGEPTEWAPLPYITEELRGLLAAEGLNLDEASRQGLERHMLDLYGDLCRLMIQRAEGDYSADTLPARLPAWEPTPTPASQSASAGVTITALFDGYAAERKPAASTIKSWTRLINHLKTFLGHDDASRVTADDIIAWKEKLLGSGGPAGRPLNAKTVQEGYLAAAKTVFGWGAENKKIKSNPADGVRVRVPKTIRLRDPGFTEEEALTILRATLREHSSRLSDEARLARRWVPWLCAYSGARVGEITQMRAEDVAKVDGVWAMRITPEAGTVKDSKARTVPLHPHLIEQGFLKVAQAKGKGPLFYDPKLARGGTAANPQHQKTSQRLADWVRGLGVDDPKVQPNHGWRHRFKTVARAARMDPEARGLIPGHAPASQGEEYGVWPMPALLVEIEKLPKWKLDQDR